MSRDEGVIRAVEVPALAIKARLEAQPLPAEQAHVGMLAGLSRGQLYCTWTNRTTRFLP